MATARFMHRTLPRSLFRSGGIFLAIAIVGLAGYYCFVEWKEAQLKLTIAEQRHVRDNDKTPLPVTLDYARPASGPGVVIVATNHSAERLGITVTLAHPAIQASVTVRLLINPHEELELAQPDGWIVAAGDTIDMRHRNHRDAHFVVPTKIKG